MNVIWVTHFILRMMYNKNVLMKSEHPSWNTRHIGRDEKI